MSNEWVRSIREYDEQRDKLGRQNPYHHYPRLTKKERNKLGHKRRMKANPGKVKEKSRIRSHQRRFNPKTRGKVLENQRRSWWKPVNIIKREKWRRDNPEKIKERIKRNYNKHKHKDAIRVKERKRGIKNAVPKWLTSTHQTEMAVVYAEATRLGLTVDHLAPLKKGGKHAPWNLWVMTSFDNDSKGARTPTAAEIAECRAQRLRRRKGLQGYMPPPFKMAAE
jgi:hypothetical protein